MSTSPGKRVLCSYTVYFFFIVTTGGFLSLAPPLNALGTNGKAPSLTNNPTPFSSAETTVPVHNWTIRLWGGCYGLEQWGDFDCSIFWGRRLFTAKVSAPCVAVGVSLSMITLITFILASGIKGRLRRMGGSIK